MLLAGLLPSSPAPAAAAATAADPAVASAPPFVRVEGRHFVKPDGRRLALKGINLGNWLLPEGYVFKLKRVKAPAEIYAGVARLLGPAAAADFWRQYRDAYITRDDILFIRAAGFNVVRLPLHHALLMRPGEPPIFEGEGYARIDDLIRWCREAGLYVVLDLHAAPGGQAGGNHDDSSYPLLFYVPRHQRATVALWRHLAARYAGEPSVLGYDLLNEPIAPFHDTALLNDRLEPLYRRIVAAIREVDRHHVIFLGGAQWNSNFEMFGPPFAPNLAYTYHQFWSKTSRDAIQKLLQFRDREDVAVWLGESGELTDAWNAAFRALNERHGIGWSFWTYKNFNTGSTVQSCMRPAGWDEVAAAIDAASLPYAAPPPPLDPAATRAVFRMLIENVRLANCTPRWSYLASLGLPPPPPPAGLAAR